MSAYFADPQNTTCHPEIPHLNAMSFRVVLATAAFAADDERVRDFVIDIPQQFQLIILGVYTSVK